MTQSQPPNRTLRTPQDLALVTLVAMGRWFAPEASEAAIAAISGQWLLNIAKLSPERIVEAESNDPS